MTPANEFRMLPKWVAEVLGVTVRILGRCAEARKLTSVRTPGGQRRYCKGEVLALRKQMIAEATA